MLDQSLRRWPSIQSHFVNVVCLFDGSVTLIRRKSMEIAPIAKQYIFTEVTRNKKRTTKHSSAHYLQLSVNRYLTVLSENAFALHGAVSEHDWAEIGPLLGLLFWIIDVSCRWYVFCHLVPACCHHRYLAAFVTRYLLCRGVSAHNHPNYCRQIAVTTPAFRNWQQALRQPSL